MQTQYVLLSVERDYLGHISVEALGLFHFLYHAEQERKRLLASDGPQLAASHREFLIKPVECTNEAEKVTTKLAEEWVKSEEDQILACLKRHGVLKYTELSKIELGCIIHRLEEEQKKIRNILEVNSIRCTAGGWRYDENNSIARSVADCMSYLRCQANKDKNV